MVINNFDDFYTAVNMSGIFCWLTITGEIKGDIIKTEKVGVVKQIEKLYKVKREDITYIGDGLTDLPIMKVSGRGILFCPNALTKAEVFASKEFDRMGKDGKFFIVEKKDMREVTKLLEQ